MTRSVPHATYVMVHSAWLGGWAWRSVASILEQQGHGVIALDLPGHGEDRTPPSEITFELYVTTVTDVLDRQADPVILVGHSLGGIVISQAAENRPDKVTALVYLCAFLLPSGGSFKKAREGVKGSLVLDNLVVARDKASVTIKEDVVHEAFAHDGPDDGFAQVKPLIGPEPTAPLGTPISITEEKWGRIPRYYVKCLADKAIPPAVQKAMYTAIPVRKVFSMDTSHTPNFSAPQELAGHSSSNVTFPALRAVGAQFIVSQATNCSGTQSVSFPALLRSGNPQTPVTQLFLGFLQFDAHRCPMTGSAPALLRVGIAVLLTGPQLVGVTLPAVLNAAYSLHSTGLQSFRIPSITVPFHGVDVIDNQFLTTLDFGGPIDVPRLQIDNNPLLETVTNISGRVRANFIVTNNISLLQSDIDARSIDTTGANVVVGNNKP